MELGIVLGITFLVIVKLIELRYYKSTWRIVGQDLSQRKLENLGEFELVIYQPDSVTLQDFRSTRQLSGINRANVFKAHDHIVFLPWDKLTFLNKYHRPFQILTNESAVGLDSIPPIWTFKLKHLEEKSDDLMLVFLAPAKKTTEVFVTIKKWKR